MAFVAPVQTSPDYTSVVVTYRTPRHGVPVYVVSSANGWIPEAMREQDPEAGSSDSEIEFSKTFKVPQSTSCITYKFRVGDGEWVWDYKMPTGKAFTISGFQNSRSRFELTIVNVEHDGFGGMNNRFDIPADLPPTPPPDTLADSIDFSIMPSRATLFDPDGPTALPSPAATPKDMENDSGTEIEAPSISDWEPTSDTDGAGGLDGCSESEVYLSH
jgi:hypothetical protein